MTERRIPMLSTCLRSVKFISCWVVVFTVYLLSTMSRTHRPSPLASPSNRATLYPVQTTRPPSPHLRPDLDLASKDMLTSIVDGRSIEIPLSPVQTTRLPSPHLRPDLDLASKEILTSIVDGRSIEIPHSQVFSSASRNSRCEFAVLAQLHNGSLGPCNSIFDNTSLYFWYDFESQLYKEPYCFENFYLTYIRNQSLPPQIYASEVEIIRVDKLLVVPFMWGSAFPHFIKDILPRIVFALPVLQKQPDIWILLQKASHHSQYFQRLGIDRSRILLTKSNLPSEHSLYSRGSRYIYQAGELFVPLCSPGPHYSGGFAPKMYDDVRKALTKSTPAKKSDVIVFVSREGADNKARRFSNENEFVNELIKQGLNVVHFKGLRMSLEKTIELFSSSKAVIGPHGGAMYNIISCQPGTLVIEFQPDDYGNKEVLNFANNLGLKFIGLIKSEMKRRSDFKRVDVQLFTSLIKDWIQNHSASLTDNLPSGWKFNPNNVL